jgi:hypothetical protein
VIDGKNNWHQTNKKIVLGEGLNEEVYLGQLHFNKGKSVCDVAVK